MKSISCNLSKSFTIREFIHSFFRMDFSRLATPLFLFIVAYLAVDLLIGLYVARRVKTSTDFILAGRSLSLPVVIATAFGSALRQSLQRLLRCSIMGFSE